MEEAEALCTRIAIMVNGRLMCIGTPQHLKRSVRMTPCREVKRVVPQLLITMRYEYIILRLSPVLYYTAPASALPLTHKCARSPPAHGDGGRGGAQFA